MREIYLAKCQPSKFVNDRKRAKEVLKFLTQNVNIYGLQEKMKTTRDHSEKRHRVLQNPKYQNFRKKISAKITNCKNTVTTQTMHQSLIEGPIVSQIERKNEKAPQSRDTITTRNRHCLRGVDRNYIQWNEILRDVLNGKLKIVLNK